MHFKGHAFFLFNVMRHEGKKIPSAERTKGKRILLMGTWDEMRGDSFEGIVALALPLLFRIALFTFGFHLIIQPVFLFHAGGMNRLVCLTDARNASQSGVDLSR
jgi:hypothetical protein